MGNKGVLSSAFNMSLGFIPVIVSILLCEFITQDISIYIGTGIGLIYSYRSLSRKGARIPNFILYISTGILTLLTLASFIPGDFVPEGALPLTLEVSILIPMVILFPASKCPMQPAVVCSRSRICHCIRTGRTDFRYSPFCCHQPDGFGSTSPHPDFHTCTLSRIAAYYIYSQHPAQSNRYPLL